jgi:hypothetical protein
MKLWIVVAIVSAAACAPHRNGDDDGDTGGSGSGSAAPTCPSCTGDGTEVLECDGTITECTSTQSCSQGACLDSCSAATDNHESVGCDYYAIDMDGTWGTDGGCYTVFVANTSRTAAHVSVEWNGQSIDLSQYAKLPQGVGQSLTYGDYDPTAGLAPNQVAILFLDYYANTNILAPSVKCPVPAALSTGPQIVGTGIGNAFHVTTDAPVVAYQMLPYGGGDAATTGASLLLPTSAWDTSYIAVEAYDTDPNAPQLIIGVTPSFDVVAAQDDTTVTINPINTIYAGSGVAQGSANVPYTVSLNAGQFLQITEKDQLSGSPVTSDKPIGVFGGNEIVAIDICCGDHAEQMLTPSRALGNLYVAAPHGDRRPEADTRVFRLYGAVDGTALTYDPPDLGPATLDAGAMAEIRSDSPFTVSSQGSDYPFSAFTYMTGAGSDDSMGGYGDADFVRLVPPAQFLSHYVFFTDVTYPFTTLTVVRQPNANGNFDDVNLDCLGGAVTGWENVGSYQIAYVKLVDHWNAQGNCNNGVHTMTSPTAFGVWVWGWGSYDTSTGWVSYGYPAGEAVTEINDVTIF